MCWGIGILLSSGVVRATLTINSDWGWRLPFVIQWVWPIPLILGAYFAPESPWWLVRQGRHEDAEKSVRRLTNNDLFSEEDARKSVANMIHTTAIEREMQNGTSYLQCFRGIDLRRTEIVRVRFFYPLVGANICAGDDGVCDTAAFGGEPDRAGCSIVRVSLFNPSCKTRITAANMCSYTTASYKRVSAPLRHTT